MDEYEVVKAIEQLPLDLRVEIVVADILNSGYSATDILVNPIGTFKRRFNKDIFESEVREFSNFPPAVVISTVRESMYDMLPQALFHNPPAKTSSPFKQVDLMIADYKKRVEEEKEARRFLMVYETEFYRQRIANAMLENNLIDAISYSMDDNEILAYWKLPDFFDKHQKGILFYLFPVFHKIRGNLQYMQEVYRLILKQKIAIAKSPSLKFMNYTDDSFSLGNNRLSADTIIGNGYYYYYPELIVKVDGLAKENLFDFLPDGKNIKIIEKLNSYFIPLYCETEIVIEVKNKDWLLKVDEQESRLGYSMSL